jgi:hydroxymethylbilane synthase
MVRCARPSFSLRRFGVSPLPDSNLARYIRSMARKVILGTRGSELARRQAFLAEEAIQRANPDLLIETRIITTHGDRAAVADSRGGLKGLFTARIEQQLLEGNVDVAVHSAKDLPSETNREAEIAAALPRAPVEDVLVSKYPGGFASLPQGASVATASVRRRRQLCWRRPDLNIVALRGNVPTRLRKLAENEWDAVVLARAGLERLGLSPSDGEFRFEAGRFFLEILPREIFLPAGGQGIIALQVRAADSAAKAVLNPVNHRESLLCLQAEREFLRGLMGDCNFPVGVLATIENGTMKLRAQVFTDDSAAPRQAGAEGACDQAKELAEELLRMIGARESR